MTAGPPAPAGVIPRELTYSGSDNLPTIWWASDISVRGKIAGYAICRLTEHGSIVLVDQGGISLVWPGKTFDAEMEAMLKTCRRAAPGDGVVCDVLTPEIFAKIMRRTTKVLNLLAREILAKKLHLARPTDDQLKDLHRECHRESRSARRRYARTISQHGHGK